MVLLLWIVYGVIKFSQMMSKHNPFISEMTEKNFLDYNTRLDLNEINFKMAFSIEGYLDNEAKVDHRYVKYIVRMYGFKNGVGF